MQLGLFWIATAWLAAGLFIGPLVSGLEPRWQKLGVDVLFVALVIIVFGSMAGEWLSVHNKLSDTMAFTLVTRAMSMWIWAAPGRSACLPVS